MPRLLPTLVGGVVGGSAANCVSLAIELRRQGVAIELLASLTPEDAARMADSPLGEVLRPLAGSGRGLVGKGLGSLYSLRRGLKACLKESRFDVVHSHSGTYPYAAVPLAADGRTCVRLHSLYCPIGARGGVYSRWWERPIVVRRLFERLDRVIAVTGNVHRSIAGIGVSVGKIESVPMCVDTRRFGPRERDGSPCYFCDAGDSLRLLYVGNASKEKGLASLLHAVRKLVDGGIPVSLVAAIENQSNVREYVAGHESAKRLVGELGIDRNVRLVGLVDRIEDLYAESDVLVIPWETSRGPSDYPMVALEAMAMGKCVVATPVGGCPELLDQGKAGVLAGGFSSEDLAAAIRSLRTQPQRRREMAKAAVRKAGELSVDASARQLISLYERLLRTKDHHG